MKSRKGLFGLLATIALMALLAGTAFAFTVGGYASYNKTAHKLSMSAGSSVQVNCNGAALHFQQLQPTIGGLTCDPFPSTTTTTAPSTSTTLATTTTTTPPTGGSCGYVASSESCWASTTGAKDSNGNVVTVASLQAGNLPAGWTKYTGSVSLSTAGATFQNAYVNGCIAINNDNITIKNVVVLYDGVSDCYGGKAPNDAASATVTMGQGYNGTPDIVGTKLQSVTIDGNNTHHIGFFANNATVDDSNLSNNDIIMWVAKNSTIRGSYIHDVAQLHLPGCNGYNDSAKDANGWWVCNPSNPNNDPNYHQDYHRDTLWAQGSTNWSLLNSYVVHSHIHLTVIGTYDFTDHSSGACLCDTSGGWGPASGIVFNTDYLHGGGGLNFLGPEPGTGGSKIVVENVRLNNVGHPYGYSYAYGPSQQGDYKSGQVWSSTSWVGLDGSYASGNLAVDGDFAGQEIPIGF